MADHGDRKPKHRSPGRIPPEDGDGVLGGHRGEPARQLGATRLVEIVRDAELDVGLAGRSAHRGQIG